MLFSEKTLDICREYAFHGRNIPIEVPMAPSNHQENNAQDFLMESMWGIGARRALEHNLNPTVGKSKWNICVVSLFHAIEEDLVVINLTTGESTQPHHWEEIQPLSVKNKLISRPRIPWLALEKSPILDKVPTYLAYSCEHWCDHKYEKVSFETIELLWIALVLTCEPPTTNFSSRLTCVY